MDLVKVVASGRYRPMEGVSKDCRDLISKMLTVQPADRITLDSIRRHSWSEGFSPDDEDDGKAADDAEALGTDAAGAANAEAADDSMQRSLHLVLPDSLATVPDDDGSKGPGINAPHKLDFRYCFTMKVLAWHRQRVFHVTTAPWRELRHPV